jgi:hypothetical protein
MMFEIACSGAVAFIIGALCGAGSRLWSRQVRKPGHR